MSRAARLALGALLLGCAPRGRTPRRDPVAAEPRAVATTDAATAPDARESGDPSRVCLPAGEFLAGRARGPARDASARRATRVSAFCIDRTLVTRSAFAAFVAASRYVTDAERQGFGLESVEGMLDWEWRRALRANWRRPFTEDNPDARAFLRDDAPVVMVSWHDAVAYCRARRGRLPTESEWEYAMGAGARGTRYPWGGDAVAPDGGARFNHWQGDSHARNERRDGHVYVSPVRAFAPNAWGIYDPVGNVWQWTADAYLPGSGHAHERARVIGSAIDAGANARDQRVLRGGSWWCAECTCDGYGLWYRGHADARAPFSNNGFRCVYDAVP